MSSFVVLQELGRELVHQQSAWSEYRILFEVELSALATTESHRLNSLLLFVHR